MKTFVVMLDTHAVRTIRSYIIPKIGDVVEDEVWVGHKIEGGKIIKVFK